MFSYWVIYLVIGSIGFDEKKKKITEIAADQWNTKNSLHRNIEIPLSLVLIGKTLNGSLIHLFNNNLPPLKAEKKYMPFKFGIKEYYFKIYSSLLVHRNWNSNKRKFSAG